MKKTLLAILILISASVSVSAQDGKSIYNKYSDSENVSAVYISPAMFRLIGRLPETAMRGSSMDFSSIVSNLRGMYVLESKNSNINNNLRKDALKFVNTGKYELLMEVKDNGETVNVFTAGKDDSVSSFVLIANEEDTCTFICLDGNMSRKQLERIIAGASQSE